jgi:hypothetical protein
VAAQQDGSKTGKRAPVSEGFSAHIYMGLQAMRWIFLMAFVGLGGCSSAPGLPVNRSQFVATMDSASVRRLCEQPDSVLAGRANCMLRDQRRPVKVF